MAAFSFQHCPFVLDSAHSPNPAIKISGLLEEGEMNASSLISSLLEEGEMNAYNSFPFYQSESFPDIPFVPTANAHSCLGNEGDAVVDKPTVDSSSLVADQADSADLVVHQQFVVDRKRKNRDELRLNSLQAKEGKGRKQKKCSSNLKETEEKKKQKQKKPKAEKSSERKANEDPPTGYIHVRARRGEATDSHSLAERVRREKISERMKLLQGLVPGCDKVIGKALMLDEIINYVQSLQNQVEVLSMKLAFYNFAMDLDDCMAKTQSLSNPPPLLCLQQPSRNQPTAFQVATNTTFPNTSNYPLMEGSHPVLLQGQRPDAFPQESVNLVWEMDSQREGMVNCAVYSNTCSFE